MPQIFVEAGLGLLRARYALSNSAHSLRRSAASLLVRAAWAMSANESPGTRRALFERALKVRFEPPDERPDVILESAVVNMIRCRLTEDPVHNSAEVFSEVGSVRRFLFEWQAGEVPKAPFVPCLGSHLYTVYKRWCDASGERLPRSLVQFISTIKNQPRWRAGVAVPTYEAINNRTKRNRKMVIPPEDLLAMSPDKVPKDGRQQGEWLTACYFKFSQAAELE